MTLNGMKIKLSGAKKSKAYWNRQGQENLEESTICEDRNRKHDQAMT